MVNKKKIQKKFITNSFLKIGFLFIFFIYLRKKNLYKSSLVKIDSPDPLFVPDLYFDSNPNNQFEALLKAGGKIDKGIKYKILPFEYIRNISKYQDGNEIVLHVSESKEFTKKTLQNIDVKNVIESNKIKYILSHNNLLIKYYNLNNSVFIYLPFHNTLWVEPIKDFDINNKIFKISYMTTGKSILIGHKMRVDLWNNYIKKINNIDIYKSSNHNNNLKSYESEILMNESSKSIFLSKYMFSIIIENDFENDWLTEKINDCLVNYTIPIYVGCKNISNYYNTKGMIICNNINEIIEKTNKLTPDDYYKRIEYIKENYKKCIDYVSDNKANKYNRLFGNNNWEFISE